MSSASIQHIMVWQISNHAVRLQNRQEWHIDNTSKAVRTESQITTASPLCGSVGKWWFDNPQSELQCLLDLCDLCKSLRNTFPGKDSGISNEILVRRWPGPILVKSITSRYAKNAMTTAYLNLWERSSLRFGCLRSIWWLKLLSGGKEHDL